LPFIPGGVTAKTRREDDIDPEDAAQVEWSLAARFRGDEDLVVRPGMKADLNVIDFARLRIPTISAG